MCWKCDNPNASPKAYERMIRDMIARVGWAVQGVEGDGVHPPYAYTVGLTWKGLPELVITGLEPTTAVRLLNGAAQETIERGPLAHGQVVRDDNGAALMEVVRVQHPTVHLRLALRICGPGVRGVQLVWPDPQGRW